MPPDPHGEVRETRNATPSWLKHTGTIGLAILVASYVALHLVSNESLEAHAQRGDALAPIADALLVAALLATLYAAHLQREQVKKQGEQLVLQRKELGLQRKELRLQRREMKASRDELKRAAEAQEKLATAQLRAVRAQHRANLLA